MLAREWSRVCRRREAGCLSVERTVTGNADRRDFRSNGEEDCKFCANGLLSIRLLYLW